MVRKVKVVWEKEIDNCIDCPHEKSEMVGVIGVNDVQVSCVKSGDKEIAFVMLANRDELRKACGVPIWCPLLEKC